MNPALYKGQRHALVFAKEFPGALVVSHDCELDKRKPRVLVAPIELLATKELAIREKIINRESPASFPLLALPGVGDCYADLRYMVSISRAEVDKLAVVASLSDQGVTLLQQHLFAFFVRLT